MNDASSLDRAREFLSDLMSDRDTSPLEIVPVIEAYAFRLGESLRRHQDREISDRELDAHAIQIRLSYTQDLMKLLAA